MNYEQALAKLQTARDVTKGKPIANNTRLFQRYAGAIAVRLHDTDIAMLWPNGDVRLDTGGWKTTVTKDRMQQFAPVRVWSHNGTWYAAHRLGADGSHLFADGMVLHADGTCTGAAPDDTPQRERALRKRIKAYAEGFADALYAGKVDAPSMGDCFCCQGMMTFGAGHIDSHISDDEQYYVPSLLVNALNACGASQLVTQSAHALMEGKPEYVYKADFVRKDIVKAIRKYCGRQLGLAV